MTTYRSLAEALDAYYRTDDLKKLAALVCSEVPGKKPDRIKAIVTALFKEPKAIFARLSPLAQQAVSETVHTWGGMFESRMFMARYSASPWADAKKGSGQGTGDLLSLFIVYGQIPGDLLETLRDFAPVPPEDQIRYAETGPGEECEVRETARAALANAAMVLAQVAEKKVRVSAKTGRATAATVRMIGELLYQGDWYDEEIGPMQAFAWPLLLQGGGLAKSDGGSLALTPAGLKALKKDLAGGIKAAWKRWEKTTLIDEFSRVTAIKGQQSAGGRTMTSPAKRRPMINMLLEALQPGGWVSVDELARLILSRDDYSFSMVNYEWKLYLFDPQYGHLDYYDTWPLLQFRYLLVYLFEYCATLGLLDVAYTDPREARDDFTECWGGDDLDFLSHCDGLEYIRINDLGAYVLGHTDTFQEKKDTTTIYAFDGRDILYTGSGEIPPGQVLFLDRIAKRREVDRWRLSASSLMSAMGGAESLAEIKTTLTASSPTGLNPEIEHLFQEVEQRSTAFVEVGLTSLIACSAEMRKQVLTDKKISRLCLPAGNRYLVSIPGKEKLLADALAAMGYTIAISPE
jgi:hypothetical protein